VLTPLLRQINVNVSGTVDAQRDRLRGYLILTPAAVDRFRQKAREIDEAHVGEKEATRKRHHSDVIDRQQSQAKRYSAYVGERVKWVSAGGNVHFGYLHSVTDMCDVVLKEVPRSVDDQQTVTCVHWDAPSVTIRHSGRQVVCYMYIEKYDET
jgi:hypothetical protein